jgi:predicted nuclease with TOPRIM domain
MTVVVGWIVVNWQNNNREERKEVRSSLSDAVEEIINLEDQAIEYHSAESRSKDSEREITKRITRLSSRMRHLGIESDGLKRAFIEFKKSMTLDNFETSRFAKQGADSEIIELISMYSEQLQDELEAQFYRSYRGPFLHRVSASIRQFLMRCKP